MKQTMKRSLAMFIVVVMFIALVPAFNLNANAAEVTYNYSSEGYIYNWGTRGVTATFLSPNAEDFYEDNNTSYSKLSSYSGGTGKSDAPSSALYRELQTLMKSNHNNINSYKENNTLLKYTDCQNGGGVISSFYSGKSIGPGWDSGNTWNKEHTWPNSKGLDGSDEDDVMMIRPTSVSENSSRGNTAYGQSSGYYNPNSESNGKYDLRGDVARIFLYVYVRWGNTSRAWGTGGVMENVDVLLAWMEADPVDTWELGRNDSVESITGTRNVFVDYPELAFLLFGEEVPANMSTPSGGAGSKCDHNNFGTGTVISATCTENGYTLYVCQVADCGYSYKDNIVAAKGHTYVSDVCTACGETKPTDPAPNSTLTIEQAITIGNSKEHNTTTIDKYYISGVVKEIQNTTYGNMYIQDGNGNSIYVYGTYSSDGSTRYDAMSTKPVAGDTVTLYGVVGNYNGAQIKNAWIVEHTPATPEGSTPSTPPTCQHTYTSTVIAPTCTAGGFTTYTCTLCGHSYTGNQTGAKGHTYADGTCVSCGATQPAAGTVTQATISFTDKANRTEISTSKQVWAQNGITVTNDKASASDNVADYSNPLRCYKGSNVTIAYPRMTKIEIDCTGLAARYVDGWTSVTNATATKSGGIVTVIFDTPVDSFTYTGLSAQSRAYSITVYTNAQSQPSTPPQQCTHANTIVVGATSATCTTNGYSGNTVCQQCNEIISQGEIIAAGHIDANNDKTCDVCGTQPGGTNTDTPEVDNPGTDTPDTNGHIYAAWVVIRVPTCTVAGLERRDCNHCSDYETRDIPALGHTDADENGICDTCEAEMRDQAEATPDDAVFEDKAEHTCEEVSGWKKFWNSIANFFRKLFGQPELCTCGEEIKKED